MQKEERIGDWIQSYSGKVIYPLDPREDEINIIDTAHSLSLLCRFTGHCSSLYTVGQHSVLVSSMCSQPNKFWGLIHDMSESALTDFPRPLKRSKGFEYYLEAEKRYMQVICKKFNLPEEMPDEVREADNRMLITERNQLMSKPPMEWNDKYEPYDIKIVPWEPKVAERRFLELFYSLYKGDAK